MLANQTERKSYLNGFLFANWPYFCAIQSYAKDGLNALPMTLIVFELYATKYTDVTQVEINRVMECKCAGQNHQDYTVSDSL